MYRFILASFLILSAVSLQSIDNVAWGFYGHRLINKLAVYTLPTPVIGLYKKHIDYITEHAVDPDKRRYATKHEGVRHYIDIDVWGDNPFEEVPRTLPDAIIKYGQFKLIAGPDTIQIQHMISEDSVTWFIDDTEALATDYRSFRQTFMKEFMPYYYEDTWLVALDSLQDLFLAADFANGFILVEDLFSAQGILPYHLERMHFRLKNAFLNADKAKVLRLSAEYGHYISDAHVPLHTTVNYNGQLTDQVGIHAFWESRIPELFAEKQYDFLVGGASYIEDVRSYVWQIVADSHAELDSVLLIEKDLSVNFPQDQQYCFDERLGRTIRIQCEEYAAAYQARMQGMVERRMQASIKAIGDLWYTAWVDAGQPDLENLNPTFPDTTEQIFVNRSLKGVRVHDN